MTDSRSAVAHAMLAWSLRTSFHGRAAAASVQREAIPWDGLLWLARQHHVQPLVYHSLTTHYAGMMPPSLQQQMHAMYQANGFESLSQMGEVLTLLNHLCTHQVQAIRCVAGSWRN